MNFHVAEPGIHWDYSESLRVSGKKHFPLRPHSGEKKRKRVLRYVDRKQKENEYDF